MRQLAKGTAMEALRYPAPGTVEARKCVREAFPPAVVKLPRPVVAKPKLPRPVVTEVERTVAPDVVVRRRECKKAVAAARIELTYYKGVIAHGDGLTCEQNPYGIGQPMERCAWSGGWFDAHRGMVQGVDYAD